MRWAALLLGLALALAACGAPQAPSPGRATLAAEQEIAALLRLGRERLERGRPAEAGDAFRAALDRSPRPAQWAQAMLGLARSERDLGRSGQALERVEQLLARGAPPDQVMEAQLLAASLELDLKRPQPALTRLRRLLSRPPGPLSQARRREARRLLARALEAAGRPAEAAAALLRLARESGPEPAPELADQISRVAGLARSSEIKPLLARADRPELRSALLIGLVEACLREGRLAEAQRTLAQLRTAPSAGRWADRLRQLDAQLSQARLVRPRAVGVILPLSGTYGAFGKRVLAAVELGLGLFSGAGVQPPTLYIEDSKNDPNTAAAAVRRLVERYKVMAIIGPVGAATSLAAARRAQQLGVPLITLSQVDGVTLAGPFVFQNFFTPEAQVDALLKEVMDRQGLQRIAVLAPRNSYGQGFSRLMAARVAARGGSLVRTVYYSPAQTDFAGQIKELVHLPPGNYRPGHPDSPKPVIDFQALFVPDGPERAAMIAPQLAYFDVGGVRLMGTNLWHNPKLIEQGGRYVEGCLFPDAFDPSSQAPLVRAFEQDFRRALGQEPGVMEAHAYDAALMVRRILMNSLPPRTRAAFRERLAGLQGLEGVCGRLSVGPERRVNKALTLFTVQSGAFVPLAKARPWPRPAQAPPSDQPSSPTRFSPPSQGSGTGGASQDGRGDSTMQHSVIPAKPMPLLPAPAASIPR